MYAVDEKPLARDAEDDSSSTAAQGHGDDDDQDNDADIAAWMDAFEADEDTACCASFQARVSPAQTQVLEEHVNLMHIEGEEEKMIIAGFESTEQTLEAQISTIC